MPRLFDEETHHWLALHAVSSEENIGNQSSCDLAALTSRYRVPFWRTVASTYALYAKKTLNAGRWHKGELQNSGAALFAETFYIHATKWTNMLIPDVM